MLPTLAALLACDPNLAPTPAPRIAMLRAAAGADTGTVTGRVTARLDSPVERNVRRFQGPPRAGVRIELGLWDGGPPTYRDTLRGTPPTDRHDRRFEVVATTVTDARGRFSFAALPKRQVFALRAVAGEPGAEVVAYFPSLFWLFTSPTMELPLELPHADSAAQSRR